jgi:S-adenosylmethionine:tRNA ribosyltransferase-isomerase
VEIHRKAEFMNYLDDYDFKLSDEKIARFPASKRDESKLMILDIKSDQISTENSFKKIISYLKVGDLLVYNSTKVSKRRVYLYSAKDREHECIFLECKSNSPESWLCLIRNSAKLKEGDILKDKGNKYQFCFNRKNNETYLATDFKMEEAIFDEIGNIPIPPYLKRRSEQLDEERYQTVFANEIGSVAAPTAGLHFTKELNDTLKKKGILFCEIVLHVGYGTFSPLTEEQFQSGKLHTEVYSISEEASDMLHTAKMENRRIISIGTTTLRAIESAYDPITKKFQSGTHSTNIFLKPDDSIHSIDGLITNFHLPKSSLLLLVAAFTGKELTMCAYNKAIEENFRFFSYGDVMFIHKDR